MFMEQRWYRVAVGEAGGWDCRQFRGPYCCGMG